MRINNPQIKGRRLSNWEWKLVVPKEDRDSVLKECHDDGVQKTIDKNSTHKTFVMKKVKTKYTTYN